MPDQQFVQFSESKYRAHRFGKIWLLDDPAAAPPISKLGPDAFLELPTLEGFSELMLKQRRTLKAVLLDQAVLSGIGNWVADEVRHSSASAYHIRH